MVLILAARPAFAEPIDDSDIQQAIDDMVAYLYRVQDRSTGGWLRSPYSTPTSAHLGGETALVALAMVYAGESFQGPHLSRGIEYLWRVDAQTVYVNALRAQLWAQLPDDFHQRLSADVNWLIAAADAAGRFHYRQPLNPTVAGAYDHSNTQFGVLGLWEGAKRGVGDNGVLALNRRHFHKVQLDDGGWAYSTARREAPSTATMTAAGLTCLLIAQSQLDRERMTVAPTVAEPIEKATAWLERNFHGPETFGRNAHSFYLMLSIERAALASGAKLLNNHDWYEAGAHTIFERMVRDRQSDAHGSIGDDTINTAFALMFLARGRAPVWVTKVKAPGQAWNNRPNDLEMFTRYISDFSEKAQNWQMLSLDAPPEHWLGPPVAYLASDSAIELTAEQKDTLKWYLDRGGMLLVNPDTGSEAFLRSMRTLARELYPQWPIRELEQDHPFYTTLFRISDKRRRLKGVSNGARELIIFADQDWGYEMQADTPGRGETWRLMTNIWAVASNRGLLAPRMTARFAAPVNKHRLKGTVALGRVIYDGDWLVEPATWEMLARRLYERTGVTIEVRDYELSLLDAADEQMPQFMHMTGVDEAALSDEQLRAMRAYIEAGGTILVETVGGRGRFAESIERQASRYLDKSIAPLPAASPVLTGKGIEGGFDARRTVFQRYAVLHHGFTTRPRLTAIRVDGRPALIFSREDLSEAALAVGHWGIVGYQRKPAERLLLNMLLHAMPRSTVAATVAEGEAD